VRVQHTARGPPESARAQLCSQRESARMPYYRSAPPTPRTPCGNARRQLGGQAGGSASLPAVSVRGAGDCPLASGVRKASGRAETRAVVHPPGHRAPWFFLLTVQYRILRSQSESAACWLLDRLAKICCGLRRLSACMHMHAASGWPGAFHVRSGPRWAPIWPPMPPQRGRGAV
jgi:hypothetical protein